MEIDPLSNIEIGHGSADGADSYRAGAEAARKAAAGIKQHPLSAVLVFASAKFALDELLRGVGSVVGRTPILGCTTAGEICNAPLEKSVVVAALASPYIEVGIGLGKGASEDWHKALTEAVNALDLLPFFSPADQTIRPRLDRDGKSAFCVLFSPGDTASADSRSSEIVEELKSLSGGRLPIFGGSPAYDRSAENHYVFLNQNAYRDSVLVAVFETSLRFGMGMAQGSGHAGSGQEALSKALRRGGIEEPALVLAFSNANRACATGEEKTEDISAMKKLCSGAPLIGFYRFGEQGLSDYGSPCHGTGTTTVLALGKELSGAAEVAVEKDRLIQELQQKAALLEKTKNELLENEVLLRDLHLKAPVAYFTVSAENGKILDCNTTAESLLGYDRETLLNGRVFDLYADTPDGKHKASKTFEQFKSGRSIKNEELQMKRASGELIWISLSVEPVRGADGTVKQSRSVVIDITERKKAEKAIQDERERLFSLLNGLPGFVYLQAPDHSVRFANHYFIDRFGDPKGRLCYEIFRGASVPCETCKPFEVFDTGVPQEYEWKQPSTGLTYQIYEYPFTDLDGSALVLELGIDITERKKAEEALKREKNLIAKINETSPAGIAVVDREGQITFANQTAEKVLGLSKERITQRSYNAPEWRITDYDGGNFPDEELPFSKIVATGEPVYGVRHAIEWPDGRRVLLSINAAPLFDDAGEIEGMVATVEDVTDRVQAEKALLAEHAFRDAIIKSAAEGLCVCHDIKEFPYVRFTVWNDRMTEITGYTMDEINRDGWYQTVYPNPEIQRKAIERMAAMRESDDLEAEEWEITRADGVKRWLRITTSVIRTGEGATHVLALMSDETDRRKLESEMQRSQKLESVGILAGGIAHDFNNLLMAVWGNIDLARMNTETGTLAHKSLEQADKACRHAKDLTQQLITFARGGAPIKKRHSLPELLHDSSSLSLSGANVKCEFDLPDGLWAADVDRGQILQVFHNLLLNAAQAMPGGGTIRVTAENLSLDASDDPPLAPGKYVKLRVSDHGTGIDKENLPRIFDPYFTTKPQSTGLGLSVVHSIISKHKGHVSVESEPGAGSAFTVYLPAGDVTGVETEYDQPHASSGGGKILVMDDEEMVRTVVKKFLEHLGYQGEFAKDGTEAIELYKQAMASGRPFDAVVLDLTVPGGMGGEEAAGRLLEIDPRARVIVTSGYSNAPLMAHYKEHGFCGVISKPFRMETLDKVLKAAVTPGH